MANQFSLLTWCRLLLFVLFYDIHLLTDAVWMEPEHNPVIVLSVPVLLPRCRLLQGFSFLLFLWYFPLTDAVCCCLNPKLYGTYPLLPRCRLLQAIYLFYCFFSVVVCLPTVFCKLFCWLMLSAADWTQIFHGHSTLHTMWLSAPVWRTSWYQLLKYAPARPRTHLWLCGVALVDWYIGKLYLLTGAVTVALKQLRRWWFWGKRSDKCAWHPSHVETS
jgi:hypothetical protein